MSHLPQAVTTKETQFIENGVYAVGSSSMQGYRSSMEDAHVIKLNVPQNPDTAYFAVFDGHNGSKISKYASGHLHHHIVRHAEFQKGNISQALSRTFVEFDQAMFNLPMLREDESGSTAVVVLLKGDTLYCANIGDSRAIGCVRGRLEQLSFDHKPNNSDEYRRIVSAGGFVMNNRINNRLAMSRAFGDYRFKGNLNKTAEEQVVTALPQIIQKTITPEWEFLVLACDGIWEVLTNEEVMSFVIGKIADGFYPQIICEQLMMKCLPPSISRAGSDNMTVVIVVFLHGRSYEDIIRKFRIKRTSGRLDTKKTTRVSFAQPSTSKGAPN